MRPNFALCSALCAFAAAMAISTLLSSCTLYRSTEHLTYSRSADSLSVRLTPTGEARWDPALDSLVITCSNCDTAGSRIVDRFEQNWGSTYAIDPEENLHLTLLYMGQEESIDLPGVRDSLSAVRHTPPHRTPRTSSAPEKPVASKPDKPVEKPVAAAPQKPKTARSVKVTAPEGVAVYKDKSKTEVLKIMPAGSVIALLAREGELLSVSVDGHEGFVEAEAVQINE